MWKRDETSENDTTPLSIGDEVIASFDYTGSFEDEISLVRGSRYVVTGLPGEPGCDVEEGWGMLHSMQHPQTSGLAPMNYVVKVAKSAPPKVAARRERQTPQQTPQQKPQQSRSKRCSKNRSKNRSKRRGKNRSKRRSKAGDCGRHATQTTHRGAEAEFRKERAKMGNEEYEQHANPEEECKM